MQAFQRAAAVFCMACIGAELVSLFGGQSWAGRCIKAAAGLYILAVLLAQLPRLPGKVLTAFSGSTAPAVLSAMQSDTLETDILTETETRLAEYCTAQCRQQFGLDASVTVTLEKAGQQVVVKKVVAAFPAGCTAAQKQAALSFLQQTLGTAPNMNQRWPQPDPSPTARTPHQSSGFQARQQSAFRASPLMPLRLPPGRLAAG